VQQIESGQPVYALDDGVMTSGKLFEFSSIENVAEACLPFVQEVARKHMKHSQLPQVVLAGWSYGGVVASVIARMLSQFTGASGAVQVRSLILFDAPLRTPRNSNDESYSTSPKIHDDAPTKDLAVANTSVSTELLENALDIRTKDHFSSCTNLLKVYYAQQEIAQAGGTNEGIKLACPVCDIRAEETDYDCGEEAVSQLTTAFIRRERVPGTHWTMLFQNNVIRVGQVLKEFLEMVNEEYV
jgi:thioesterase domain-containing protein